MGEQRSDFEEAGEVCVLSEVHQREGECGWFFFVWGGDQVGRGG